MRTAVVTRGGQVSIPAEIRHRWGSSRVSVEDLGDAVILRPIPDDPIAAVMGSLAGPGPSTDEMRELARAEDAEREERLGRDRE